MVRSVTTNPNSNVFAPFETSGVNYAISKPITNEQKQEKQEEKEEKSAHLGRKVALTALGVGIASLFLAKGMPKSARLNVARYFRYLEEKIERISTKNKNLSFAQDIYLKTLKGIRNTVAKSKALFNFGPVKDVLLLKLRKVPLFEKTFNTITRVFEKISVWSSRRVYRKTMTKFDSMSATFSQINERLLKENPDKVINGKTVREWIKEIEEKNKSILEYYQESFGMAAQDKRFVKTKSHLNGLEQRVYDVTWEKVFRGGFKGLWDNPRTWIKAKGTHLKELYKTPSLSQGFISEEFAASDKIKLAKEVHGLRRPISNSFEDTHSEIKEIIENLDSFVFGDKDAKPLMRKLRDFADEYRGLGHNAEDAKKVELNGRISETLEKLKAHISGSNKYDTKITKVASGYIGELDSVLKSHKQGEVQDILDIYRQILPEGDYHKVTKSANNAVAALNKSVNVETDKLFDKLRDLQIGSAPMDALFMLVPLGIVGHGLSKADDNDERISVGLKHGMPIIGAIATALVFTAGLVSGGQAIIGALIAELTLKQAGTYADNKRKAFQGHPAIEKAKPSNKSIEQKLLDQVC